MRVVPRSATAGVGGTREGALVVRLHAPPVEGAANAELVEVIARTLQVPRRQVTIVAGERSRRKRVRVEGVTVDFVNAKLETEDSKSGSGI